MPSNLISLGQILDHTWDFYTKHFRTLMKITVWYFLITLFVIIGSLLSPVGNAQFLIEQNLLTVGHIIGMALTILAPTIGTGIVSIWVFLSLVRTTHELQSTKTIDLKQVSKKTWRQFLPYALMSILRSIIFIVPVLAIVPGLVLIGFSLNTNSIGFSGFSILLSLVGMLTALVLLVILFVWFAFPGYEMVIEGKGVIDSLKASKKLVRGRFWATVWRLLVPKLIFTIFIIIGQVVIYLIFTAFIVNPSIAPETFVRLTDGLGNLILTGISVLTLPLYVIADYYIFDSLKKN